MFQRTMAAAVLAGMAACAGPEATRAQQPAGVPAQRVETSRGTSLPQLSHEQRLILSLRTYEGKATLDCRTIECRRAYLQSFRELTRLRLSDQIETLALMTLALGDESDMGYMDLAAYAHSRGQTAAALHYASIARRLTTGPDERAKCHADRRREDGSLTRPMPGVPSEFTVDFCPVSLMDLENAFIADLTPRSPPRTATVERAPPHPAHAARPGAEASRVPERERPAARPPAVAQRQAPPKPATDPSEAKDREKYRAILEATVAEDSKAWLANRYDRGSMRVELWKVGDDGIAVAKGRYTFNNGRDGWVVLRLSRDKPECLMYWDFDGVCRAPHDIAAIQRHQREQEREARNPAPAEAHARKEECERRRKQDVDSGFFLGPGDISIGKLWASEWAAGPPCQ